MVEALQKVGHMCFLQGLFKLDVLETGAFRITVQDVIADGARKEQGILEDKPDL